MAPYCSAPNSHPQHSPLRSHSSSIPYNSFPNFFPAILIYLKGTKMSNIGSTLCWGRHRTYYVHRLYQCTMRQRKKPLFILSPSSYFLPQLLSQPFIGIFPISSLTIPKPLHNHINSGRNTIFINISGNRHNTSPLVWELSLYLNNNTCCIERYQEQQQKQPPLSKVTLPHIIVSLSARHVHYGYTVYYTNRTCTCFSSLSVIFVVNHD